MAISPNGKYVALGHLGGSITLWETATTDDDGKAGFGSYLSTIWNGNGVDSIGQLEFLPNSTTLAFSHIGTWALHLRDIHTGMQNKRKSN